MWKEPHLIIHGRRGVCVVVDARATPLPWSAFHQSSSFPTMRHLPTVRILCPTGSSGRGEVEDERRRRGGTGEGGGEQLVGSRGLSRRREKLRENMFPFCHVLRLVSHHARAMSWILLPACNLGLRGFISFGMSEARIQQEHERHARKKLNSTRLFQIARVTQRMEENIQCTLSKEPLWATYQNKKANR